MPSIQKTGLLFLLLTWAVHAPAQRLNTGLSLDFYGINFTKFPSDVVFSETNYRAYYVDPTQAPKDAQLANYGLNIAVEYNRYFAKIRGNFSNLMNGIVYKYSYPISGDRMQDYYTRILFQRTELSGSFGYLLNTQKFLKPYIELGYGRVFPYLYAEDFSTDKDFKSLWRGRHEVKELMQLDKSYNFLMLSFGYRMDMLSVYARYSARLGNYDVFYSNLSFGIAFYTKFSKLRKHYIYQPED
jgi:hypothetical protein